uniref:Uncharacterized protein n=1 Tax=Coccidioides posadasii RMSCC 3488 TaxID=454284 RepID=A0A0J6FA91_COCPO|nr:hypothetical protein CPAG_06288 [Coccidioides posadasii RMSCC 3488]
MASMEYEIELCKIFVDADSNQGGSTYGPAGHDGPLLYKVPIIRTRICIFHCIVDRKQGSIFTGKAIEVERRKATSASFLVRPVSTDPAYRSEMIKKAMGITKAVWSGVEGLGQFAGLEVSYSCAHGDLSTLAVGRRVKRVQLRNSVMCSLSWGTAA